MHISASHHSYTRMQGYTHRTGLNYIQYMVKLLASAIAERPLCLYVTVYNMWLLIIKRKIIILKY